jgi:hypothetical protein
VAGEAREPIYPRWGADSARATRVDCTIELREVEPRVWRRLLVRYPRSVRRTRRSRIDQTSRCVPAGMIASSPSRSSTWASSGEGAWSQNVVPEDLSTNWHWWFWMPS